MTPGPGADLRVVVLAPSEPLLESVRRALSAGDIPIHPWQPVDPGAPGPPPVQPDTLILDGSGGVDVAAVLRSGQREGWLTAAAPVFVLVNPPVAREQHRDWLRAGVWELVRLPVDEELFQLQVRNFLRGRAAEDDGVVREPYSRAALLRVAEEHLSLAARYHRPLSAAAFCLDWGERRGDEPARSLLRRLAGTAQAAARGSDLVGVTTGGALLVLLPDTDEPGAEVFADRLESLLQQRLREWEVLGRIRTGWVIADDDTSASAEAFLEAAEACL